MRCERLFIYVKLLIEKMKYSREYIIRRAFDVFMDKGYDSASITVLQTELNMSRGAMYRYFKNKDELFRSVIDIYFFRFFNRLKNEPVENETIKNYIDSIHRRQKLLLSMFTRAGVTHTVFMNYTALMIQAVKHYPDFLIRFKEIQKSLLDNWKKALQNSINAGEIRDDLDIDIMASLFNNISLKESSADEYEDSKFAINVLKEMDRRKDVLDYLYNLIKL